MQKKSLIALVEADNRYIGIEDDCETHFLPVALALSDNVPHNTLCDKCSHVWGPSFSDHLSNKI